MDGKFLGKIQAVEFGIYDHSRFGLSLAFSLDGGSAGVDWFTGAGGGLTCKIDEYTKWTEADRDADFAKLCRFVNQTLLDAKRTSLMELEGIPVEVTIERGSLKSWRVLTEVL